MNSLIKRLIHNYVDGVSAYQYYQILRFGATVLIGIILVKTNLPIAEIAIYEFLLFFSNMIAFSWSLGLKNALLAYYPSKSNLGKGLIFQFFVLLFILGIAFSLLAGVCSSKLVPLLVNFEVPYLKLILVYLVINTPTLVIENVYILHKEHARMMRYASWIYGLQLCLILGSIVVFGSLYSLVLALIIWAVIKFLWAISTLRRVSQFSLDWKQMGGLLFFSIPLIFHMLTSNAVEFVDGIIVSKFFDEEHFLIYRYGARELPYVMLVIGALTSVMLPRAVDDLTVSLGETKLRIGKLMNWMFPLTILLVLISPLIYPIIYSVELKASAYLLNIYALIICSRILLPQLVLWGKHRTKLLFGFTSIELIINISLSLLLANYWGIYGIAFASVIAFIAGKVMMICFNYIKYGIPLEAYLPVKKYLFYSFVLICAFAVSMQY